ncbi:MAG TPA: methylenetetrahydrofolate reductase [Candidatus Sulfotelmatobacter sp.]
MTYAPAAPSLADMLRGFSIELNPGDKKIVQTAVAGLAPGTQVFLTWVPGVNPMNMIGAAAKLRRAGLLPVPHIAARHLASSAQLRQLADCLANEAGVDRILIVGGDCAEPVGPFDSTLAVLQTEVFQQAGIRRIGIGGFPEGNPSIPDGVLDEALDAKLRFGRSHGLDLFIVTQFCFTAEPIVKWLKRIRGSGIDVPVRVGLAGPASLITLTRYAIRCGIGNSLHVLTENPTFARLLTEKGPEPIIRGIAAASSDGAIPLGIAGLHFFVFGGFSKTVDWIQTHRAR